MSDGAGPDTRGVFPTTRWTLIRDAQDPASPDYRRALDHLAALYWRPIYAYFRRRWSRSPEEAHDLTQDFFCALCEKDFLQRLSPEHGRFRSYVMAALDNFARLDHRQRSALKRGGGAARFPLDDARDLPPAAEASPETVFLREWARAILSQAVDELEAELRQAGQEAQFRIFARRDLEAGPEGPPSYEELARETGLTVPSVTNFLYRARKRLRELVLIRVRDTVTDEREAEIEMKELFEKGLPG